MSETTNPTALKLLDPLRLIQPTKTITFFFAFSASLRPLDNCSCVVLDCCSRHNSTSSILGVVPSPVLGLVRKKLYINLIRHQRFYFIRIFKYVFTQNIMTDFCYQHVIFYPDTDVMPFFSYFFMVCRNI